MEVPDLSMAWFESVMMGYLVVVVMVVVMKPLVVSMESVLTVLELGLDGFVVLDKAKSALKNIYVS